MENDIVAQMVELTQNSPLQFDTFNNGSLSAGLMGTTASQILLNSGNDYNLLRPYFNDNWMQDKRQFVTRNAYNKEKGVFEPKTMVFNNPVWQATLRKMDWILLDEAILKVAKPRLRAVGDLRSAGLQFTMPDGMAKTVLEYERQSDITPATISMSGIRQSEGDRPVFDLNHLPLPIIHKDFFLDARQVMASRTGYSPLDTTTAELAGRRVAEGAEQLLIGSIPNYNFGGGSVYGYTNFPQRITYNLTHQPTSASWTPQVTVDDVLQMITQSMLAFHTGPWMLYHGLDWNPYMEQDYAFLSAGGSAPAVTSAMTLRDRLKKMNGILDVRNLDYLDYGQSPNSPSSNFTLLLVQMTAEVTRLVMGLDITTLQWETHGGMQLNFKVMAIMVPQLRADMNNNTGIVHASGTGS